MAAPNNIEIVTWGVGYYLTLPYSYTNYWQDKYDEFDEKPYNNSFFYSSSGGRGEFLFFTNDSASAGRIKFITDNYLWNSKWVPTSAEYNILTNHTDVRIPMNNLWGKTSWLTKNTGGRVSNLYTSASAYLTNSKYYPIYSAVSSLKADYGIYSTESLPIFDYLDIDKNVLSVSKATTGNFSNSITISSEIYRDSKSATVSSVSTNPIRVDFAWSNSDGYLPSGNTYSFNGNSIVYIDDNYIGSYIYSRLNIEKFISVKNTDVSNFILRLRNTPALSSAYFQAPTSIATS